ncbi:MAG: hypothetical protein NTW08_03325 [Gammaproteobacteria bacterium]|nr:hypothetical protein [Gammaproteobacteria bacterium]
MSQFFRALAKTISCLLIAVLVGCVTHDDAYYQTHPKAVFEALQHCVSGDIAKPQDCQQIEKIASVFRGWMNEIQSNSQAFGQKIIKIQQYCGQVSLSKEKKEKCHQELEMRLAVVKWLESPES